jgi:hypothetical protein
MALNKIQQLMLLGKRQTNFLFKREEEGEEEKEK